ncbi:hypothetical protein DEM27_01550 [Metarhizobium album]|uniref:Helix-turn-helix domain-containing protein n=2 Tax=Metarhizobium album TaxID=2182425 RepID=A0A2U2DX52_9HYPH|nr:hypothetical protein DEM27_01550 [Rhizobium album]
MSERPELPDKNDIPIAYRAVCLSPISGGAKQIAAIIIGHFNVKTGQCDPGTDTLMRRANLSKRAVIKATEELNRTGLVVKIRHGGNGFRSQYQPKWKLFREVVDAFVSDDNAAEIVHKSALSRCTKVHLDSALLCTLTKARNSSKKLKGSDGASGGVEPTWPESSSSAEIAERVRGLVKMSVQHPHQFQRGPLTVVDAEAVARHRLNQAIDAQGETVRSFVLERITPEIEQAGVIAEMKSKGSGLRLVVDRVSSIAAERKI